MDFHVMDEPIVVEVRGLALVLEDGAPPALQAGSRIRDARGNVHTISTISQQEDLTILMISQGDADYFGRLFRNIMLDATCFTLLPEGA